MINERGITLTTLALTIVLLGILMAVTLNIRTYNGIMDKKVKIQNEYNGTINNVEEDIDSIQKQWEGVL